MIFIMKSREKWIENLYINLMITFKMKKFKNKKMHYVEHSDLFNYSAKTIMLL